jgi:ankyrin repeat protein
LLNQGADLNAKDNNRWTALIWEAEEGHTAAVQLLKQARTFQNQAP